MHAHSSGTQTECHAIKVLGGPEAVNPATIPTFSPVSARLAAAASQVFDGGAPLMLAEVAVSGPVRRSNAFASGWATTRMAIFSPPSRASSGSRAGRMTVSL